MSQNIVRQSAKDKMAKVGFSAKKITTFCNYIESSSSHYISNDTFHKILDSGKLPSFIMENNHAK
jgi:hypothetical protein